jgi:hypothetical protein
MGYTHYWRRSPELNRAAFIQAVEDIRQIVDKLIEQGVKIAGPKGLTRAELSDSTIAFNGAAGCGHRYRDLGDPFPSKTAEGVEATNDVISAGEP